MRSIRVRRSLAGSVVAWCLLVGAAASAAVAPAFSPPRLLGDLVPGVGTVPFQGTPELVLPTGGRVLFSADGQAGRELWSSDGTPAGTGRLYLGESGYVFASWARAGQVELLLQAYSGGDGPSLYRSDGTQSGTRSVALWLDAPLIGWFAHSEQRSWVAPCSYRANRYRCELWTIEGAATAATKIAADLELVQANSYEQPVAGGQVLFFSRAPASSRLALWRSDGTAAGTVPVLQLPEASEIGWLGKRGGRVFFRLDDAGPGTGSTLWSSDGTAAGTRPLRYLRAAEPYSLEWPPFRGEGPLFFAVYRPTTEATELWVLRDGRGASRLGSFEDLQGPAAVRTAAGGTVYVFTAAQPGLLPGEPVRLRLWATDGTPGGTRPLTAGPTAPAIELPLGAAGGRFFFTGFDSEHGAEPWVSDGTPRGTRRLADVCPGACGVALGGVVDLGGAALFVADRLGAQSLWRSDGTPAGTARVAALASGSVLLDDRPLGLVAAGRAFFVVSGRDGSRLWTSDGTTDGTAALAAGPTEALGSSPVALAASAGTLLLTAADPLDDQRRRLYLLRGSEPLSAGVVLPYPTFPSAAVLDDERGLALFTTGQLWATDGTPAGTVELTAFGKRAADKSHDDCDDFVTLPGREGDRWLFAAYVCDEGEQMWSTDGALAGTRREPGPPEASHLFRFDGQLYYTASVEGDDGTELPQLFRTSLDGGAPTQLTDVAGGVVASGSWPLPGLGRFLFLRGGGSRSELWVSDGTAGGTGPITVDSADGPPLADVEAAAVGPGFVLAWQRATGNSQPALHVVVPASRIATRLASQRSSDPYRVERAACPAGVVFAGHDAAHGFEPWISDGTPAGTHRLADLAPGAASSRPRDLVAGAGGVFFAARTPETGEELWFTDGTAAGTVLVADLAPGPAPSSPRGPVAGPGRLLFAADDGSSGREPWLLEWSPPAAATAQGAQP